VRTADSECGGYLTCFDRFGRLTDTDKYIWFQGRQLWMFSHLYRALEPRENWIRLAQLGRNFLVEHAYAGDGRWHYRLDRAGSVKQGTISIYTDLFVLGGLCEFAVASGSCEDSALIETTFDAIERNVLDPQFKSIYHGTWSERYDRHGIYMISLCKAAIARQVLGADRTKALIDHCLRKILYTFAQDEHQALFESVSRDGSFIDEAEGRLLNPGHALESMWFCIEEGLFRNDRAIVERAIAIIDWMYCRGYDAQYGGLVSFVDLTEGDPPQTDWHRATGMQWHDKAWWVHCEALYALALAAAESGQAAFSQRFCELYDWCQNHFADREYGEWYSELYRNGSPKVLDKGTKWKAAYHLPRALLRLLKLLERPENQWITNTPMRSEEHDQNIGNFSTVSTTT
jgi:N-acylglucosamine 2-epimerase